MVLARRNRVAAEVLERILNLNSEDSGDESQRDSEEEAGHEHPDPISCEEMREEDCYRLGRRGEKIRPIKVVCASPYQRAHLLRCAPQIPRLNASLGYEKVFIKPDLSPKEQEAHRSLRKELIRRRGAGENIVIRDGKIIPSTRSKHQD